MSVCSVLSIPRLLAAPFLGFAPFGLTEVRLARALAWQNVTPIVDTGRDSFSWLGLRDRLQHEPTGSLGLRVADGQALPVLMPFPASVAFLVVPGHLLEQCSASDLPVIAQVCSRDEAEAALAAGVMGLIAQGQESGGCRGDESTFVLLQRLLALTEDRNIPVWCQGGIGLHTAAAAFAGGATGVVLDSVLAGLPECHLPDDLRQRVLAMDGSASPAAGDGDDPRLAVIGQDAALARLALAQCSSLDALVNTLRTRIVGQLHQARELRVLDEGNAWAQAHGTRYPIAQGPMTRVSDTAAFSAAVAEAGALPFTALSLMSAEASRQLLSETRDALAGKPWGVGVLGFADPTILEPQLALVREFRPDVLLLAGGRPSQARPFQALGIATYLHVPSPGLLELFLKEGATHFVFEGRECGGHVGPRYSFVLWEQALAVLLAHDRPETLNVLFAGGIHDARSSAMVAALAAPLAARGARIGVLMGTAYVMTEEAVQSGAVLPEFQRRALVGETTALVETAPGHAIRCVPSGFMDLFAREKARLQAEGVETREAWQRLEALTVGRLRIASKGVDRVDGALVSVPLETQSAEGMYMLGQVVALRDRVQTMADLHAAVTRDAMAHLRALPLPALMSTLMPKGRVEPVAIVGMACLYPGSPDLESYWENILAGRDLIGEVPAERWSVSQYYRGANAPADKSVSRWGGFIADTPFDPLQYGIPPASLAAIEPVQLLSLEITRQALRDAGYEQRWFDRERTSVIFGAEAGMDLGNQYTFRNLWQQYAGDLPPVLAEALPALTEDSFPGMLVNVISGRIANRLGLGGVNYAVTSACASSLTAIELAVKELRAGTSEMVLAGGADFHNGINDYLMFSSVGALSPSGRCRSFDNAADGIVLGEGVGVVVLKRLSDAERDGDRIYAIIDGIAGSSDGKGLGLTAPRKEGQKRALERAYWQAGVLPAEIGLVEAHGTGTVVGDRTELQTLTEVFAAGGALPGRTGLGSVKSQIGHTKCAAGIAGIIKLAKALHHRVLPGTQQINQPNAWHHAETNPFALNAQAMPWLPLPDAPTRAAVSAFGFGGANFHAVLSARPDQVSRFGAQAFPVELFAVRGGSEAEALDILARIEHYLAAATARVNLRDLARTAWEAGSGPVQLAFVADSLDSLRARIASARGDRRDAALAWRPAADLSGKLAFLFSGQGSQHPGMLRELFVYFPTLQAVLAEGRTHLPAMYPATAYDETTRARQLQAITDTRQAQPALGLVEWAASDWLRGLGLTPDMAAGHSYGELAALATAGSFDLPTLVALSRARAEAMMSVVGDDAGSMAAVSLDVAALTPLLAAFPTVVMANQNSPQQTVISGPTADVAAAVASLKQQGVGAKAIATACAFHSPLMAAAGSRFAEALAPLSLAAPRWPVYANIDAAPHAGDDDSLRARLASHITSPVRFVDQITRMYDDGARVFVEIGPRKVLTGLVGRILKDQPHVAVALDQDEGSLQGLLSALSRLAVLLPAFDASALFDSRGVRLDLDTPPQLSATTWMVNGGSAWPLKGKLPAHAAAVVTAPVLSGGNLSTPAALPVNGVPASVATIAAGEQALVSYLNNMRDLVTAQRDVLLGYFGTAPALTTRSSQAAPLATVSSVSPSAATAVSVTQAPPPSVLSLPLSAAPEVPVADYRAVLLTLVSDRTGYPADMLDLDLDLEADLSIDSIKRLEIIGELSQRLSLRERLGQYADTLLDQLAACKTLRAVLEWLETRVPTNTASTEAVSQPKAPPVLALDAVLLGIVSACTGYPVEALDLDLDLEADLSIDSIKRLEIVGQLSAHMDTGATGADRDAQLDSLAACKTLRAMITWLQPHQSTASTSTEVAAVERTSAATAEASESETEIPFARYILRAEAIPAPAAALAVNGLRILITEDDRGIASLVAANLRAQGAEVSVLGFPAEDSTVSPDADQALARCDALIHLAAVRADASIAGVKQFFPLIRAAVMGPLRHLLVLEDQGGDFSGRGASTQGGGLAGMVKSLAREFPGLRASWLDAAAAEGAEAIAAYVLAELRANDTVIEAAWRDGQRFQRSCLPQVLAEDAVSDLPLGPDSVVLLTGGARGITALVAVELARRYRCHLELVGRSPVPEGDEPATTRAITDPRQLRQALLAEDQGRKPAEVERLTRRLLAERECRATFAAIAAAGGSVRYSALDVRDGEAFSQLIADIYTSRGRIDGVIHGAGVVEDKLVRDKQEDSFARVFDTKVNGALILRQQVRDDVGFVVFFSSVASAFGNRGQIDYASANDVLDKLAHRWQADIDGRVLSVNWGPWADTGMVSDSLRQEYARKGIGLVPQQAGVAALLAELGARNPETQVVLMSGLPERFTGTPAGVLA